MALAVREKILPVLIFIVVVCSLGCGPKRPIATVPAEKGEGLFAKAEKLLGQNKNDAALAQYLAFVNTYPSSSLIPAALMRAGEIYAARGDYEAAYATYRRILDQYAGTVFAPDAAVEMLSMLYRQGKYPELIQQSAQLPKASLKRRHMMRISVLAGDAFLAMDATVEAAYAFIAAYRNAQTAAERETVTGRLRQAVSLLTEDDVRMLSLRLKNREEIDLVHNLHRTALFRPDTIGCMLPLTGPYEVYGNRALKGIELALNRFSAQEGRSLKIIVKDTRSDAETAKKCVRDLVKEKAACIIGPIATAAAACTAAQENRIPIIALTQKDGIPETGEYVFRNFMTPNMQVKALVSYAVNQAGARRFALLYPKERYGETFMNLFWDEVIKSGGEVVGAESYDLDQTDFEEPVKKLVGLYYEIPEDLKPVEDVMPESFPLPDDALEGMPGSDNTVDAQLEDNPPNDPEAEAADEDTETDEPRPIVDFDMLFLPDSPKMAGMIIPQLAYYDVDNVILSGTNLWHSNALIDMAGAYAQGAVLTDGFFGESQALPVRLFMTAYTEAYGESPGFIEAIAYDTAMLVYAVLARGNISLREDIVDALQEMPYFDGVTGITAFDEVGEAEKRLYLLRITRSRFAESEY